jgi:RHS repeat-associated protein
VIATPLKNVPTKSKSENTFAVPRDVFFYNLAGQMVAEYTTSNLTTGGGTSYLTMDTLGTPRIISGTNINDNTGGVKARHDYLPFGEELGLSGGRTEAQGYVVDSVKQKFTSKERDVETGLDYFQARYYASAQGRFTSVDPIAVTTKQMVNPQRWNKYTYVINNPLALYDPNGQEDKGSAGRIIDVFLVFHPSKRGDFKGPDWAGLKREAERRKATLRVHDQMESTAANISTALKGSGTVIIIGDTEGASTPGKFKAQSIESQEGWITPRGVAITPEVVNRFGFITQEGTYGPKPEVIAPVVALFTCNATDLPETIFTRRNQNTLFVVNDGGEDGLTDSNESEGAAFIFVRSLIRGSNVQEAMDNANGYYRDVERTDPTHANADGELLSVPRRNLQ